MNEELQLSKKSRSFIENLRVYLFSKGKNPDEMEEILEELEIHLFEAEKSGKPTEKIIGKSPKEYMEMVSDEMTIDYRTWTKYILLIIFGMLSFTIFQDLLEGSLSYSVMEIVGHIIIGAIFIAAVLTGFKYLSANTLSAMRRGLIFVTLGMLPGALFIGLIYLNRAVDTPVIHFGYTGTFIIAIITALFIIGISFWAKTWIAIIIVGLLTLPDYFLSLTSLKYETQLITSTCITFGGIAIYLWILNKLEKDK